MKPSVVIATMGGGVLDRVVDVFLASHPDIEVIIVADSPKIDAKTFLARQRKDKRVQVLFNEANIGVPRSLNRGLDCVTGDIVFRNDDDDVPSVNRVARLMDHFARNPQCDLVYSYAAGIDAASGSRWVIRGPTDDATIKIELQKRNFIVHSTLALRTSAIRALGGYNTTFRYAQDYDLYLRAIRAGMIFGGVPEILIERFYHADAITVRNRWRQILFSFAARLIHEAESGSRNSAWKTMFAYARVLAVPDVARRFRRRLGYGR
jgi:GT2 family glycosyltransferase